MGLFRSKETLHPDAYTHPADDPAATLDRPADVLESRILAGVAKVDAALRRMPDPRLRDDLLDIRLALTGARA